MELISGHPIVRIFGILCVFVFASSCTYKEALIAKNNNNNIISILDEQNFWKNWQSRNDDSTCPLEPIITSHTEDIIKRLEKTIYNLGEFDESILIMRVNVSNGIYQVHYYAWKEPMSSISFVKWDSFEEKIMSGRKGKTKYSYDKVYSMLDGFSVLTDLERRRILDGSSIYISTLKGGQFRRFATYEPNIDTSSQKQFPLIYIDYLENLLKKSK